MSPTVVSSSINFLANEDLYDHEKPYLLKFEPPSEFPRSNYKISTKVQDIQDIRGVEHDFSIPKNGFSIMPLQTKMSYEDFDDETRLREVYFKEVAEALQLLLGAFRVQIFEHLVSSQYMSLKKGSRSDGAGSQTTYIFSNCHG